MLGENFPSWFTIPKTLWSSVTFLGGGMSLMADIFAGSWEMPSWLIGWPRKVSDDLENSHLVGLSVMPAALILFSAAVRRLLCSWLSFPCTRIIHVAENPRDTLQYIVHHLLEDPQGAGDSKGEFVETILPKGRDKGGKERGRFCKGDLPKPTSGV